MRKRAQDSCGYSGSHRQEAERVLELLRAYGDDDCDLQRSLPAALLVLGLLPESQWAVPSRQDIVEPGGRTQAQMLLAGVVAAAVWDWERGNGDQLTLAAFLASGACRAICECTGLNWDALIWALRPGGRLAWSHLPRPSATAAPPSLANFYIASPGGSRHKRGKGGK